MLTTEQQVVLKAFIDGDPTLSGIVNNEDGAFEIANRLNLVASPAYVVWRTDVAVDEVMRNGMDWTRVDNLSVGKARIWDWMTRIGTFNPSKLNVRAGIDATWVGTASDLAVRDAVYVHCKRSATVLEKIFAVGAGTTLSPSTMAVEGLIGYSEVFAARGI